MLVVVDIEDVALVFAAGACIAGGHRGGTTGRKFRTGAGGTPSMSTKVMLPTKHTLSSTERVWTELEEVSPEHTQKNEPES